MNEFAVPILAFFVFGLSAIILVFAYNGPSIQLDEAFKVTSDTSKYSCIVSEIDNDLLLECLKVK